MSDTIIAPIWRRLAAIGYDAFLLAALWMVAAMAVTLASQLLPIAGQLLMRVVIFLVGLAFFAWFWTRGGQTLGMRTWRVRVERINGSPLRAPTALLRYMAGLLPIVCALYGVARFGGIASPIALLGYAPCFFDERKRAFNDLVAGTQIVLVSAQGSQSQQSDEHQQQRRQSG